jgi:hypothetical protein
MPRSKGTLIHGETHIVVLKLAIAFERDTTATVVILAINARSEEWISTLEAESVVRDVRFPSSGSSRVMKRSSTMGVLQ